MKLHASTLLNFNSCEKLVRFLLRKAVLCLTSNKINSLLSPPGPECENEASECPQFHFMPRFVRFLPGKTLNKRQRPTALLSFAICLILVVSGDAVLGLKPATEKKKDKKTAKRLPVPELLCSCMVFITDTHDGAAALWYLPQCFVMTAVPRTFFSIKKQFLSLLPPPNLVRYKHLSACFTKALQKNNTVHCNVSDVICEEKEKESERSRS